MLASVLAFVPSCGGKAPPADLPAPPAGLVADQIDPRPVIPADAATSESAYEAWVSDVFDWGARRDLQARRWCEWANTWLADKPRCE